MKRYCLSLLLFFSIPVCRGQFSDLSQLTPKDYIQMNLPPLEEFFKQLSHSSGVKLYELRTEEALSTLKTEKRSWLKYFSVSSSYHFGVIGINATTTSTNQPLIYQYSSNSQNWYNVGATISVPFHDLFDRRNRIKKEQIKVQEIEAESERYQDEQKLLIVDFYTDVQRCLTLLKINAEALGIADAQYRVSEKDFINGKLDVQTWSNQKNIQTSAVIAYEETRSALHKAILKLEIITKIKLINK